MKRIGIVGIGLIGGSILKKLRETESNELWAFDHTDALSVLPSGLARLVPIDDAFRKGFVALDLLVLATPVKAIAALLPAALESGAIVTDCGSTKRYLARHAAGLNNIGRFVPGHPMAGRPVGGFAHATADLFEDRSWILCPAKSEPSATNEVVRLVRSLGAQVVTMTVDEHDRAVALTSHLPQLLASCLQNRARQEGVEAAAGPGFRSATRVAGGPATIWADILESNWDEVQRAWNGLRGDLDTALQRSTPSQALELLARAEIQKR